MEIGLAKSFYEGLARLSVEEQDIVRKAVFAFVQDPKHSSFKLHKLDKLKTKGFWSAYINKDLRLILKREEGWTLVYVGHHDKAYQWAETHRADVHPKLGVLQVYEVVKETIKKTRVVTEEVRPIFAHYSDDYLLSLGVPLTYIKPLKQIEEDQLFDFIAGLPQDVQERLVDLASGQTVLPPPQIGPAEDLARHLTTPQHIKYIESLGELSSALRNPWEQWVIFLHPAQREAAERKFNGPARVTGAAGTGKTVVALHRTALLAKRYPGKPILLTTFNRSLAARLRASLEILMGEIPDNITVDNLHALAVREFERAFGKLRVAKEDAIGPLIAKHIAGLSFEERFAISEFAFADSWGLYSWDEYKNFPRVGRFIPLTARQRLALFKAFEKTWRALESSGLYTFHMVLHRVREAVEQGKVHGYNSIVVDEAQDFGPAELLLLRTLARQGSDDLFFALDPAQRIYKHPLSWSAMGLEVRGRSIRLRVNYRTTREISSLAESVLPANIEGESRDVLSLLRGPSPRIYPAANQKEAATEIVKWARWLMDGGVNSSSIAVLARTKYLARAVANDLKKSGLPVSELGKFDDTTNGIACGTIHGAKGMEFRSVAIFGASEDFFPLKKLLLGSLTEHDRKLIMDRERNLLYVAASRAREQLLVVYWGNPSPFLEPD